MPATDSLPAFPPPAAYRVEDRGHATPCWIWTRAVQSAGYGALRVAGRVMLAHRHAYEQAVGPIPAGLTIDHLCGQRLCVNAAHLEPVTIRENSRRGRKAKLTFELAEAIRSCVAGGEPTLLVADAFGVSQVHVGRIVRREQWA